MKSEAQHMLEVRAPEEGWWGRLGFLRVGKGGAEITGHEGNLETWLPRQ